MSLLIHGTGRYGHAVLLLVCLASLTLEAGCRRQEPDPRLPILEEQTKMLMILEAKQGFVEIFKSQFDPAKTRLLLGADLNNWLQERKKSLKGVPEPTRAAIAANQGAGLLIQEGVPGVNGGKQDVVYLRPPRFGFNRVFVRDVDPCGDGNPAQCEFCSGCSGESSPGGIIHTCVCTMGCGDCRVCPSCS
jgi:hypothetical protein